MNGNRKPVLCALTLVALASCALMPRRKLEVFPHEPVPPRASWSIGTVEVEHKTMEERIRRLLPEALALAAGKHGFTAASDPARAFLLLDVWASERDFSKGLQTLNSVSFSTIVRERESGKVLLRAIYTEETEDTLVSFYHLYDIVDMMAGSVADALKAQEKRAR